MKNLILGLVMVGALGVALILVPSDYVSTPEVIEIEKEVTPDWASDKEAVEAAQAVIRRKALEAELNVLESNFEATTATYEADKAAYKAEKERLERDLGVY